MTWYARGMRLVIELPTFTHLAHGRLSEAELHDLITFISTHPDAGDLIPGAGGARKLRRGASGQGVG